SSKNAAKSSTGSIVPPPVDREAEPQPHKAPSPEDHRPFDRLCEADHGMSKLTAGERGRQPPVHPARSPPRRLGGRGALDRRMLVDHNRLGLGQPNVAAGGGDLLRGLLEALGPASLEVAIEHDWCHGRENS